MSYSRSFGMRSFENIVRDGRARVPSTGTAFKIGAPVMLDPANPGRLKAATEAVDPGPNTGIVVFEHIQNKGDALVGPYDAPHDSVPLGQYAQMVHGAGAKVWFKQTADKALYDGRTQAGYEFIVDAIGSLAIGDGLVPDGAGKFRKTDGSTTADVGGKAWLVIEQINTSTGVVEARFTF